MRAAGPVGALMMLAAVAGEAAVLPSGLEARLMEVRRETGAAGARVMRFRFVAEGFSRDMAFEAIEADLEYLCAEVALPQLGEQAEGASVIVSVADRVSEFGMAAPSVAQVFEVFRVRDGRCIWEVF